MSRRAFRAAVLCYHSVTDDWPDALSIGAGTLERQVRMFLRLGYRPASLDESVDGSRRTLHVSFDDAFRNVRSALPILERLGVPVTVFACTGYADDGRPLDVPELAERRRGYEHALSTMRWDELRALSQRGIEIGSHAVSHPHLPRLDDAELDRELLESRTHIEDELGRPCRYLAYPFGDVDERVRAATRRAGYVAAFALPGPVRPSDLYELPRVGIYRGDGLPRLLLKSSVVARRAAASSRSLRSGV